MGMRIIQLGAGNVGMELVKLARGRLDYLAVCDRSGAVCDTNGDGLSESRLDEIVKIKKENGKISDLNGSKNREIVNELLMKEGKRVILVDVTASDDNVPLLLEAKRNGCFVVLANKKPLCGSHQTYKKLVADGKTYYGATVGAGVPVIRMIRYLKSSGDRIHEIGGCFSGTLGFICTELGSGKKFSESVRKARELGYTEPNPRDDLSGMDVARKALILGRELGFEMELEDIAVEPMLGPSPSEFLKLSAEEFMEKIEALDQYYAGMSKKAETNGNVLRYVAEVKKGGFTVGLKAVPAKGLMGATLEGRDNIFSIKSAHYDKLMMSGAGAGPLNTASSVFADITDIIERGEEG